LRARSYGLSSPITAAWSASDNASTSDGAGGLAGVELLTAIVGQRGQDPG
jgi:hypothetical protein